MAVADTLQSLQESLQGFDINDLDFQNIGAWPLVIKVVAWVLVFVICMFGGYKLLVEDAMANMERVASEESALKEEFSKKAFEAANLKAYRKQMEEMKQSFGALVGQLPSDTEVPGLLEDITNKGIGSGLDFESIDLKAERRAEFYVELPIQIVVSGAYHDMGSFVSGVAGLPRIVTLHDFLIEAASQDDLSKLKMNITAKTYRYKDEEDLAKESKKAKKGKKKRGKK